VRGVSGFISVSNPELIVAEGLLLGREQLQGSIQRALQAIDALRAA
jgi:FMN-dependent NADH-azoreductase